MLEYPLGKIGDNSIDEIIGLRDNMGDMIKDSRISRQCGDCPIAVRSVQKIKAIKRRNLICRLKKRLDII